MGKKLFLFTLTILGLISAPFVYTYWTQESVLFQKQPLPDEFTYLFDSSFEEHFLETPNQGKINYLHFKVDNPKGIIVYYHGRGGNLNKPWGPTAQDFTVHGYDVVMMDYRGFGKSRGTLNHDVLLSDALTFFHHIQTENPDSPLIIYGCSLGTGVASYVASKTSASLLILESPYFNLIDLAKTARPYLNDFLARLIVKYPFRTDEWIQNVACNVYIFHALEDELIPYDSSLRLAKLIKSNVKLISIHDSGHHNITQSPSYHLHLKKILLKI